MGAQDILEGLIGIPSVIQPQTAEASHLMDFPSLLEVSLIVNGALGRVSNEEGIMGITGRVRLRLEERIEVPEGTFDVSISPHLLEAHLSQHLRELLLGLHERMKVAVVDGKTLRVGIELLERMLPPTAVQEHAAREFSLHALPLLPVVFALADNIDILVSFLHQLSPLEFLDHLRGQFLIPFQFETNQCLLGPVHKSLLSPANEFIFDGDQLILDCIAEGQLIGLRRGELLRKGFLIDSFQSSQGVELIFRATVIGVHLALLSKHESGCFLGLKFNVIVALQTQNFWIDLIRRDIEEVFEVSGGQCLLSCQYLEGLILNHHY